MFVCKCGREYKKFSNLYFHCSKYHPNEVEFVMERVKDPIDQLFRGAAMTLLQNH